MLKSISRVRIVQAWCAALIVIGLVGVVGGAALTTSNGVLWLLTCLVPPAVMLLVWRGAPPLTVAELLYAVEQPSKVGRP